MEEKYLKEHIEYSEETLLNQRRVKQKEKYSSLDSGMYIDDRLEKFSKASLFDEKMQVTLPESFGIMPEDFARVKYPSSFRPHIIFTKGDMSVNIGFSLFLQKGSEADLEGMSTHTKNILKRANPIIQFYSEETVYSTNCKKVWYDFRTQALDEAMYNIHFYTIINECVMQGMFNCLYRHVDDWYDMATQIIESVTDLTKERMKTQLIR